MASISKLPSGSWRARVFLSTGKYKSITAPTKKEVARLAALAEMDRRAEITFGAALQQLIDSRRNVCSPNTIRYYESAGRAALAPLAPVSLSKLTTKYLQQIIDELSIGRAPKTVRNFYGIITTVLRFCDYPIPKGIKLPKKEKKQINVPSDDDIRHLIDSCSDADLKSAITIAAYTGLRRGELTALDNVDLDRCTITIDKAFVRDPAGGFSLQPPKTSDSYRTIRIPRPVAQLISDNIEATGRAVSISPHQLTMRYHRYAESVGLGSVRFHDLRHYCCSLMIAEGIPEAYIAHHLGHHDTHMIKEVYGHVMQGRYDAFADKMDASVSNFLTK